MSVLFINWLLEKKATKTSFLVGLIVGYILIHIDIWIIRSIIEYIRGY